MRSQGPRCWNRQKPQGRTNGSAVPREAQRMEPALQRRRFVTWTASIRCRRCRGLLYRSQLRDWGEVADRIVVMLCHVLPVGTSSTR